MKQWQCKRQCKKFIASIVITMVLVVNVGGALAYLTASSKKSNTIEIAQNEIVAIEEFEQPIPGEKTVKRPQAENVGNVDCYVRAKILLSDSRAESYLEYYYENALGFNYADWSENIDGWLYYQSVLGVGQLTAPIFDHIKLNEAISSEISELHIDVLFESVQSEGFSNPIEAFGTIS